MPLDINISASQWELYKDDTKEAIMFARRMSEQLATVISATLRKVADGEIEPERAADHAENQFGIWLSAYKTARKLGACDSEPRSRAAREIARFFPSNY